MEARLGQTCHPCNDTSFLAGIPSSGWCESCLHLSRGACEVLNSRAGDRNLSALGGLTERMVSCEKDPHLGNPFSSQLLHTLIILLEQGLAKDEKRHKRDF